MEQFLDICAKHETMRQILGNFMNRDDEFDLEDNVDKVPDALKRLTGPTYGLKDIIDSGRSEKKRDPLPGPIKDAYLFKILEYLFPDSSEAPDFPYPETLGRNPTQESENFNNFRTELSGIKSCPVDGLVWRLSVVSAHCLHILGKSVLFVLWMMTCK